MADASVHIISVDGADAVFFLKEDGSAAFGDGTGAAVAPDLKRFSVPGSVVIGGSEHLITEISDHAFRDCASLEEVSLPDTVARIGEQAFYGCTELRSVLLPEIGEIEDGTFCGCSSLTSVRIPCSVRSVHSAAFDGCASLEEIRVDPGSSVYRDIGGVLFSEDGCTLIRYPMGRRDPVYEVPGCVHAIGPESFSGTLYLHRLSVPFGVSDIDPRALYCCLSLSEVKVCDMNPDYRSDNGVLFSRDGSVLIRFPPQMKCSEYVVPGDVLRIGFWAFGGCTGLRAVILPNGLESVSDFAFAGCSMLNAADIPASVASVGWGSYIGCDSLAAVDIRGNATDVHGDSFDHPFCDREGSRMPAPGGRFYRLDRVSLTFVTDD